MRIGIWEIINQKPKRLDSASIGLEKHLEDWIEADSSLLQSGLVIVARQMAVEGGVIDLLAIDTQGRWIVIEIKRGQLDRDTVAQVQDYESCIATIPTNELITKTNSYLKPRGLTIQRLLEERSADDAIDLDSRDIEMVVVGVGKMPGLDRMANRLSNQYQMPLSIVSFEAVKGDNNQILLVRELVEPDYSLDPKPPKTSTVEERCEEICSLADKAGVGDSFREILSIANELGLYTRPYKKSIMYTPSSQRNRMLFTVWAEKKNNGLRIFVRPSIFAEFYPISEEEAAACLDLDNTGWQYMEDKKVTAFLDGAKRLFESIAEKTGI